MTPDHAHPHDEHRPAHGGWRHAVGSVLRPHSHDAADSVDPALEGSVEGVRAVKVSLVLLGVTALLQGLVVLWSGSVALLADTIHNVADALTAVPLWIAFVVGRRAPTRRYTYGFGRAEDLAGLFVVAMIALSAVLAGVEGVRRLLDPQPVTGLGWVAAAGLVGFIGNEVVARYRIVVGRRIGSAALVADGLHARTDGFTSLAVLVGAGGVALGWEAADPVVGLLITVAILAVLRTAARDVWRRLMDGVDPAHVDAATTAAAGVPGVEDVAGLRLRWLGHAQRAEVDVTVADDLPLRSAHAIAHDVERAVRTAVPRVDAATVHAYPAHGAAGAEPVR